MYEVFQGRNKKISQLPEIKKVGIVMSTFRDYTTDFKVVKGEI